MTRRKNIKTPKRLDKDNSKTQTEINLLTLDLNATIKAEDASKKKPVRSSQRSRKICKKNKDKKIETVKKHINKQPKIRKNMEPGIVETVYCQKHTKSIIEFMCVDQDYIKELCSYCMLEHKDRIKNIFAIKELIEKVKEEIANEPLEQFKNKIQDNQRVSLKVLDNVSEKIIQLLNRNINKCKERLIFDDDKLNSSIAKKDEFRRYFIKEANTSTTGSKTTVSNSSKSTVCPTPMRITRKSIDALKDVIKCKRVDQTNGFVIEEEIIQNLFKNILKNNIVYLSNGFCVNTTATNIPKVLHWFEWDSRDLHLLDVVTYTHSVIKLMIPFKVPSFSRSIIIPDGRIYLIGGEDKRDGPQNECYVIKPFAPENSRVLIPKAPMLAKKYDFTICYLLGRIYTLCGKNINGGIVNTCEYYDINRDSWRTISPTVKKRYAAAAASLKETNRVYLFGGRGDHHNEMINDIEEYDPVLNEWRVIELIKPIEWKSVEVCAAIQIRRGEIMVFGGSDINVEDSRHSFIVKVEDNTIVRTGDLKKPHVFVSTPFIYGNHLFAVGNEYYVKDRVVHKYDIEKGIWDILF